MPTAGRGFLFQLTIPVQLWLGGSRQSEQNFPPQCWQVNGSVVSQPQLSQRVIDLHVVFFVLRTLPAAEFTVVNPRPPSKTVIAAAGQRLFFHVPKPVEKQRLLDARYFAG
jgi:hypothetical protein